MKRYNNLYQQIISIENLNLADKKARLGKTLSRGVFLHDLNREENIKNLHEMLKNHVYKTSKYDLFKIYEPKERLIYRLPYYPDRIVHHAVMNVLEPIWVKVFTYNTYSCIKNRGITACAKLVRKILNRHKNKILYCLKIDILKYYPSIDHDILKSILRRKIKDVELLLLLDEIIDSAPGVPIGNYLSLYFSNLYSAYFMHYINNLKVESVLYADDYCFFSENKEYLHRLFFKEIKPYLENKLKLKIKHNYQIFPISENRYDKHGRALDFVGYKFYMEHQLLRKRIKQNFCRKHKRLVKHNVSKKELRSQISSWLGWTYRTSSKNLLNKLNIKR